MFNSFLYFQVYSIHVFLWNLISFEKELKIHGVIVPPCIKHWAKGIQGLQDYSINITNLIFGSHYHEKRSTFRCCNCVVHKKLSDKNSAWIILHCANSKVSSIFSGWSLVGEHFLANVEEATTKAVAVPKTFSMATIYVYIYIYIYGQDLCTILRCCFLSSPLNIQPFGFFSHRMEVYFLVK